MGGADIAGPVPARTWIATGLTYWRDTVHRPAASLTRTRAWSPASIRTRPNWARGGGRPARRRRWLGATTTGFARTAACPTLRTRGEPQSSTAPGAPDSARTE